MTLDIRPFAIVGVVVAALGLSACAPLQFEGALRMEGPLEMRIEGPLEMRIDGPLEVRIEGPLVFSDGSYISDENFARLEVGSDAGWAVALFGEPDQRTTLSDGTEVWRWQFRHVGTNPSLVSIGEGDVENPTSPDLKSTMVVTTFVHVRDGLVIDKWRG